MIIMILGIYFEYELWIDFTYRFYIGLKEILKIAFEC